MDLNISYHDGKVNERYISQTVLRQYNSILKNNNLPADTSIAWVTDSIKNEHLKFIESLQLDSVAYFKVTLSPTQHFLRV